MKILVMFHTPSNAGYAMAALEKIFLKTASKLTGSQEKVFFSFSDLDAGPPKSLPGDFKNVIALNYKDIGTFDSASCYIKEKGIEYAFCFDVQPNAKVCTMLRKNGIKNIVSYWGSTISSKNGPVKLALKKLLLAFNKNKPDHFIFESEAMRDLAVNGRGISMKQTSVIPTGIDTSLFKPAKNKSDYLTTEFKIPSDAKVVFYSGHMEERKGVRTIIESAIELLQSPENNHIHFLICGNRPGEEEKFIAMLQKSNALGHVHFAGYRNDLPTIMPQCHIGVVASTGWDSFPMSTLEMAGCGLPIIVSRLQGLIETVDDHVTGLTFTPGSAKELTNCILLLLNDEQRYNKMSVSAVARIKGKYTTEHQIANLEGCLASVFSGY
ncbi:glycosyltransferase family 4 protein [Simiduia curdlanivorans]|uniref:Glycosyltransferase family 4 protein n=1 Tax=Simiduia curdlanivorans TaxID=1492769 RepID=A0ABV8VCE2_9GAMM|nr:glycosyltransferase family 4 protein [Simiduia curdlanivorans]MDN3638506.1 glycosyltransferase family 4 protein [Simiduia curdlanivorans]